MKNRPGESIHTWKKPVAKIDPFPQVNPWKEHTRIVAEDLLPQGTGGTLKVLEG